MAFETVSIATRTFGEALPTGYCSVAKSGDALFHAEDLALVGIVDRAVLLADGGELRVGLRQPREGDTDIVAVRPAANGSSRRRVNLKRALLTIGIEPRAVRGERFELHTIGEVMFIKASEPTSRVDVGR